ncbi:MAG: molybdenum cofactor biosynthesis protein B [Litorivicinus sp.]
MVVTEPMRCAVLTVSDTRSLDEDKSGHYLVGALKDMGHEVIAHQVLRDEPYDIRAQVCRWIADPDPQVVLLTGGTGFSGRDSTVEAIEPIFDTTIQGFGELFRQLSYQDIGSSTVQSRAIAGLSNNTFVAALPGSTGACRLAFEKILREQLDSTHKPCNFVNLLKRGDARRS